LKMIDMKELSAPFNPDKVHWRVGSTTKDNSKGLALAYLDARDVQDRLDNVCGVENWQSDYIDAGNGKTCCRIGIKIGDEWIWKADGAGDTAIEGDKGAFSDAFKRAAVSWGIGRYLYRLENIWVALSPMGKSYKIADSEKAKLARFLGNMPAPGTAKPAVSEDDSQKVLSKYKRGIDDILENGTLDDLNTWGKDIATDSVKMTVDHVEKLRKKFKEAHSTMKQKG